MNALAKSSRRDLLTALTALAALAAIPAEAQLPSQTKAAAIPPASTPTDPVLSHPHAFAFDKLPVHQNANGSASRAVTQGVLPTGEFVELHETTLLPGQMPHPAHKHRHSEFMLIREGLIEFDNDGTPERVGPGGVIFCASMIMHGIKNVGETPANYFVIAIGRETGVTPV